MPSTAYQSSAPDDQAAMMPVVTEASSTISRGSSSTIQPAVPDANLPLSDDSNVLLTQLYIPPYGLLPGPPELYSGPSAGSPHLSSADSCHSSGSEYAKVQISTQPYSIPQDRDRSSSVASVSVDPWYHPKSPHSSSSALSTWNEFEPIPPLNIYGPPLQSVGTPTLDYIYHANRAQMFPEPSVRVPLSELDGIEFHELRRQLAGSPGTIMDENGLVKVDHDKLLEYLDCYWQRFHPLFPIIHRPTFSGAPPLLTASMMAIGAQFSARPDAKLYANSLHQACSQLFTKVSSARHVLLGVRSNIS